MNWWVEEVSDTVHWDTDGLSIIDPRQVDHVVELIEPLRDYGFDPAVLERAFIPFRIDKDLGKNRVRLIRVKDSILESDDKLFALPDILDDENSLYSDFLDHVTRLRVKMLNDLFDFEQKLTVDEVEDEIREEDNADFMEGRAIHLYNEVLNVLEYTPVGWESDEDEDTPRRKKADEEDSDEDFPDVEEDEEALKGDQSLKWDEDEDEEQDEDGNPKPKSGADDDEETDDEDDEGAKPKKSADDEEEEDDEAPVAKSKKKAKAAEEPARRRKGRR